MHLNGIEIVEKKNVLNEIRHNNMTLQELRFFSIYLSKINARDESTRKVRFRLEEFQKIMDLGRMNIQHFKDVTDSLLCKVVHVPNEDGTKGYTAFQMFKKCKVYENKEDYNRWYVEIDAHDDALPLMFNFKKNYFKYELWNALKLRSRNQLHMYELLKQYEMVGVREIELKQLKDWLGLIDNEYKRWEKFKTDVLNKCQVALKKYTDIQFEYEAIKTGRRVTGVRFLINKNETYEDPVKLCDFISEVGTIEGRNRQKIAMRREINKGEQYRDETLEYLAGACSYEFSEEKMMVIRDLLFSMGYCREDNLLETYEYLLDRYHELNAKENIPKTSIERRFGFLKWLIKFDME